MIVLQYKYSKRLVRIAWEKEKWKSIDLWESFI